MPEQIPTILERLQADAAARRKRKVMDAASFILRGWIAQTPGALPSFATDQAPAAMAVAESYVQAGDDWAAPAEPEAPSE